MQRLAVFLLLLAPAIAWAEEDKGVNKIIIGDATPLFTKCYERAQNGGDTYEALEPCNRSLNEEVLTVRKKAIVHANRGVIYFHIGEYSAAVNDFTRALDLGIHVRARILANRGLSYEAMSYDARARADYQAALAINPDDRLARRRLAELEKPIYERSRLPKRIRADTPLPPAVGI